MKPADLPHSTDEEGEHDEDECYRCLASKEVHSTCRCGACCGLIIEVDVRDAEVEPRIKNKGSPIYADPPETGTRELIGYLLNSKENDYACAFLDRSCKLCTIYETRPLVCRLFDCDGDDRQKLVQLGILPAR